MIQDSELEPMERLAERVGRTEPEVPSIAIPIAAQRDLARETDQATSHGLERDSDLGWNIS